MAAPHLPVAHALRLPEEFSHVPGYLALHDAELRVRRSVERPSMFILERRCRRRPPIHTAILDTSDRHVQARDGYIHVSTVHPAWLIRPWNIIRELKEAGADVFAEGADKIADDLEYEQRWRDETDRRERKQEWRAMAHEGYDVLSRTGNTNGTERTRFSNPGLTPVQVRQRQKHRAKLARRASRGR